MAGRILIIRGGAIGDFILTLPSIGLLRANLPDTRIEILGYPSIASLALAPHYADAVHSIEYAPLAQFFSRRPILDPSMIEFFAGFQQIISYLFDPDGIFERNVRSAGVKNFLAAPGKINDEAHAVQQLSRPLQNLAFFLEDTAPRISPSPEDAESAQSVLSQITGAFVVLHPGSGGKHKTWPAERWRGIIADCQNLSFTVLLVGGEADSESLARLKDLPGVLLATDLPLRTLAAIVSKATLFLGHDSGISHLSAATGAQCLLLFGPTDPDIWAPLNPQVEIITSPDGSMSGIDVSHVQHRAQTILKGSSTSLLRFNSH